MTDLFLSYRTALRAEVAPLLAALSARGHSAWRDEERVDEGESISEAVRKGLSEARALIVWASADYQESRICLIELRAAWIAAMGAGPPERRISLILPPGVEPRDLPPLRPEMDLLYFRAPQDAAGWELLAQKLGQGLPPRDAPTLGQLQPIGRKARWYPHAQHSSPRFVGRQRELWQLHALLQDEQMVAVTGIQKGGPARLQGLGGVGKSSLAIQYATLFEAAWPGGIYYLKLSDGQDREGREAALARAMGLSGSTDAERAAALRHHLCQSKEPYLWLLDDVPSFFSAQEVQQHAAPGGPGRTLVTTRSRAWQGLGRELDLDVLSPDEARHLLLCRRNGLPVESEAAARQLCAQVGHLPLALDLLAALQEQFAAAESEWCRRLNQPEEDALEWAADLAEDLPTGCSKSVAAVLWQSLHLLKRPESWSLLLSLASLADAPLPLELLPELLGGSGPPNERAARAALAELRQHSLLPARGLSLHSLLRRVLLRMPERQHQREQGRQQLLALWTRRLDSVDANDMRSHGSIQALLPHVSALVGDCAGLADAGLAVRAAHIWQSQGAFSAARRGWELALEAQMSPATLCGPPERLLGHDLGTTRRP